MLNSIENNKKIGLRGSLLICLALVLIGLALQLSVGAFSMEVIGRTVGILNVPIHIVLLLLVVIFAVIFLLIFANNKLGDFLAGGDAALASIISIGVLALILGITTQYANPHPNDLAGSLGLRNMTSFWPFVLIYIHLIVCLVFATIKRLSKGFSVRNVGFFLNHAGLLLLLYFIGAGASQTLQYSMTTSERVDTPEWRATNVKTEEVDELPIAIRLKDFVMEEYPPKLAVVHRGTGKVQPENTPEYFDIDSIRNKGKLLHWEIKIEEFIPLAVPKDSASYEALPMPGAHPACLVNVRDVKADKDYTSWISSGNSSQGLVYKYLDLGDSLVLAMTEAEPKRFYSDVDVYIANEGILQDKRVEVNKPLVAGNWVVYQSDYDKRLGTSSEISVFDLVYDPWRKHEYFSIILLSIGTIFMFWQGKTKKNNKL
ncbi:MAG: cytochrome c biogenesis protein ResB [Bacteroidales bacterium]